MSFHFSEYNNLEILKFVTSVYFTDKFSNIQFSSEWLLKTCVHSILPGSELPDKYIVVHQILIHDVTKYCAKDRRHPTHRWVCRTLWRTHWRMLWFSLGSHHATWVRLNIANPGVSPCFSPMLKVRPLGRGHDTNSPLTHSITYVRHQGVGLARTDIHARLYARRYVAASKQHVAAHAWHTCLPPKPH